MERSLALSTVAYLVAAVLFILSLRGLSSQETAKRGHVYGIVGMAIAIGATLSFRGADFHPRLLGSIAVAVVIAPMMTST